MYFYAPPLAARMLCLLFLLFAALSPSILHASQNTPTATLHFTHTVTHPYGSILSREHATDIATMLGQHALVDMVAGWLASHTPIGLAFSRSSPRSLADTVLTSQTMHPKILYNEADSTVIVTVAVALVPSSTAKQAQSLLRQQPLLELHARSLKREEHLLERLVLHTSRHGTPHTQQAVPKANIAQLIHGLQSMHTYRTALRLLQADGIWQNPQKALQEMQGAIALDRSNPLPWHARGKIYYQMERPIEAMKSHSKALQLAPDFARIWHARGIAYLKLHLPELALDDFSQALKLAPREAEFWQSRGAAYLAVNNLEAMCADYGKACGLGQCQGLHWARSRGYCTPPMAALPPDSPKPQTPAPTGPSLAAGSIPDCLSQPKGQHPPAGWHPMQATPLTVSGRPFPLEQTLSLSPEPGRMRLAFTPKLTHTLLNPVTRARQHYDALTRSIDLVPRTPFLPLPTRTATDTVE